MSVIINGPTKHGQAAGVNKRPTPEYNTWAGMIRRCHNPNDRSYARYGASGITVCDEWRASFTAFFEHMGVRPSPKHSIDRIRSNEGYKPGNCRWATAREQANNQKTNVRVTHDGVTRTVAEWAQILGMNYFTLAWRIRSGWDVQRAFTKKPQ